MSRTAARLTRAEQNGHQRVLAELAKRRGVLRWVCYASDAEPDPNARGCWRSPTYELFLSVPEPLLEQAVVAIGYEFGIEPDPNHDDEQD